MYHCYAMWSLRCSVNFVRTAVSELISFHHSHLSPVREINIVLKKTDTKWVWDYSTSMDNSFSIRKNLRTLINTPK